MKLHLCFDIDETLTHHFIDGDTELTPEIIKGASHGISDLLNKAIEDGHHVSFTTYKSDEILVNKVLQQAGVTPENLQKVAIIAFKPKHTDILGKNLHCTEACKVHDIEPEKHTHVLFDDCQQNCSLFKKARGASVLVNGGLSHIDVLKQILDRPDKAFKITEDHESKANEKRINNSAMIC